MTRGEIDGVRGLLSALMGPSPLAILIGTLVALSLPLLLHLYIYRSSNRTTLPAFLLVGPSGAGKTTFLTHVIGSEAAE